MKRMVCVLAVLVGLVLNVHAQEPRHQDFSEQAIQAMEKTRAVIHTRLGDIKLRFFPEVAPNHVHNFIQLAQKGFYDKTTFHRVIPGFMIQGGDPNTKDDNRANDGQGGPGYTLKAEFNKRPHQRGTLSMARAADPDSAGSQFFICVADAPHLDGQYTVFGEVVEGMETADKIVSQPADPRNNPKERIEMTVEIIEPETASEPRPESDSKASPEKQAPEKAVSDEAAGEKASEGQKSPDLGGSERQ